MVGSVSQKGMRPPYHRVGRFELRRAGLRCLLDGHRLRFYSDYFRVGDIRRATQRCMHLRPAALQSAIGLPDQKIPDLAGEK